MNHRFPSATSKASVMGFIILLTVVTCVSQVPQSAPKTTSQAKEDSDYQNLQRARHLLLMKNDVKALDDVPMRCLVRLEIVRFIYDNDVRNEFDSADAVSVDYFEDIAANSGQIPGWDAARWQNFILPMLGKSLLIWRRS